jgi:hypothetical protein
VIVSILGTFNSSQCAQRRIQTLVQQSIRGSNYRIQNQNMMGGIPMQPMLNPLQMNRPVMNGNMGGGRKNHRNGGNYSNNNNLRCHSAKRPLNALSKSCLLPFKKRPHRIFWDR